MVADQLVAATGVADGAVVVGRRLGARCGADGHREDHKRKPPEDRLLPVGGGPAPGTGGKRVCSHESQDALAHCPQECGGPVSEGGGSHTLHLLCRWTRSARPKSSSSVRVIPRAQLCERLLSLASPLDLYAEELEAAHGPPPRQLPPGLHPPGAHQRGHARDPRRAAAGGVTSGSGL